MSHKKINIRSYITVLAISIAPLLSGSFIQDPEKLAKTFAVGLSEGLIDQLKPTEKGLTQTGEILLKTCSNLAKSPEAKRLIKDTSETIVLDGMKAAGKDFSRGLDSLTIDATNAVGKNMKIAAQKNKEDVNETTKIMGETLNLATQNFADAAGKSVDTIGQKIQQKTGADTEIDRGIKGIITLAERNTSKAVNTIFIKNIVKVSSVLLSVSATYWSLMYGIPLGFRMLERKWTRPKLIIKSSQKSFYQKVFGVKAEPIMQMIFSSHLEKDLNDIVLITKMIHNKIKEGKTNVKYRNLLLYGPPGTGKTLFATELAKQSGLEYAFMSGSSFAKFKDGEGIEALDELFAWANNTSGLLIFIDEAETFLLKRENMDPQSKAYLLLNNFLNYTGTRSDKFMIVFATNHKNALDSAMYRRIDDLIEISLPGKNERIKLLNLYIKNILLSAQNEQAFKDSVKAVLTSNAIENIALQTKGLSGGELEGIVNALKTSADILDPSILTHTVVNEVVAKAVQKQQSFTGGKYLGMIQD